MKQHLIKARNLSWWVLTNIISAGAFRAAISNHRFAAIYLLLSIVVWPIYLIPWYSRMKLAKNRGADEHPIAYYLRTFWRINLSKDIA